MTEQLDSLFKQLSHGVYVVGVRDGDLCNAFTAAWVMQASFSPPMLAISINPGNYSYRLLKAGGICSVNVLDGSQLATAAHFGCSGLPDKMAGFAWQQDQTGAPILSASLVYFDCRVRAWAEAGDHCIAVCDVVSAGRLRQGRPMLYRDTGDMDGGGALYQDGGLAHDARA